MTIEERANKYANNIHPMVRTNERCGYIHGATEQREIDIQRAVEYTCNGCCFVNRCKLKPHGRECFNIKLLRQAMKGE